MRKIFYILTVAIMLLIGCVGTAHAEFAERPVGLVAMDYGSNVHKALYKQSIYAPVRWAYHFPYYKIHDDEQLTQNISKVLCAKKVKVTPQLLKQLAEQNKMDVLVVAKIYEINEELVPSIGINNWDGPNMLTRVTCWADLYCYRLDKDKLLTKRLRERFLSEGGYEKPQDTLKWQLSKLVNTMEGRPIIGGDN